MINVYRFVRATRPSCTNDIIRKFGEVGDKFFFTSRNVRTITKLQQFIALVRNTALKFVRIEIKIITRVVRIINSLITRVIRLCVINDNGVLYHY